MPRLYAWDLATRARALENGCFLVASNRIGSEKDSVFCGHSRIVDPQGTVIIDAGLQEAAILASIDLADISAQRQRIPYLVDRKPDVYRQVPLDSLAVHPSPVAVQEADNYSPTVIFKKLG
jgi:predicted amidohydrolase